MSIRQAVEACKGKGDFIVFGEAALQGFNSLSWKYEIDRSMAVAQTDDPIRQICQIARQNHIAVSFGYIERNDEFLFSSQIVINSDGVVIYNFRRVSIGWKSYWLTDSHYREGKRFKPFSFLGKRIAIGLCGDLWTDGKPEEMRELNVDIVLWPVNCNFLSDDWNQTVKYEYAEQAALCGERVLYVNPFCTDPNAVDCATGGAAYFRNGTIEAELPAGNSSMLCIEI